MTKLAARESRLALPVAPKVAGRPLSAKRVASKLGRPPLLAGHRKSPVCRATSSAVPAVTTPHSGYHYDGTARRFFEGWYFKVTMPESGESFALIYSVQDPTGQTDQAGVGAQVMGPGDGYIVQYDTKVKNFWAERNTLALGHCFENHPNQSGPKRMVSEEAFGKSVKLGFQSSGTFHQGHIIQKEEGAPGHIPNSVESCRWCFDVHNVYGWGNSGEAQKPTAGWLALLPVFEPHWQVMMAHGLASGWFEWGDKRYEFRDAPAYYEKNWGAGFPSRWLWVQCNTFDGYPDLCLTAVGARRELGLQQTEEDVGMIGVHYQGKFYELVPWNGEVEWDVSPWGYWCIRAKTANTESELIVTTTPTSGTRLRAPTADDGLTPLCKDSFFGSAHLKMWKRQAGNRGALIVDAKSTTAAVEVGGGPWWDNWTARAEMKEPLRSLVQLPIDVGTISQIMPPPFKPPGL